VGEPTYGATREIASNNLLAIFLAPIGEPVSCMELPQNTIADVGRSTRYFGPDRMNVINSDVVFGRGAYAEKTVPARRPALAGEIGRAPGVGDGTAHDHD
jgi:hypothetical protein